jgi:hypothetical protein
VRLSSWPGKADFKIQTITFLFFRFKKNQVNPDNNAKIFGTNLLKKHHLKRQINPFLTRAISIKHSLLTKYNHQAGVFRVSLRNIYLPGPLLYHK